jgi:histidine ammonia-lyase
MTNPQSSQLPAFLVANAGLHSGFTILHVAAAALVSETKAMAMPPHSVDSIPASANLEDYLSMGMSAARRLATMLENVRSIIAIELLAAAQGLDFLAPLGTGEKVQRSYELVRSVSKFVGEDRSLSKDIAAVADLVDSCRFQEIVMG